MPSFEYRLDVTVLTLFSPSFVCFFGTMWSGTPTIFSFNRFPRGHHLVWWVRVRVSLGVKVNVSVEVRVRVRVSNLLGLG